MPVPSRPFPNDGCHKAFDCGKLFVIMGGTPTSPNLPIALTFCDSHLEEIFFLMGCAEEARDFEELVSHA